MKSIRDKTGCRIAVPGPNDEKKDIITVMGTKEGVAEAKKILEAEVAKLKDLKEEEVSVPQKYHKNFTQAWHHLFDIYREIDLRFFSLIVCMM